MASIFAAMIAMACMLLGTYGVQGINQQLTKSQAVRETVEKYAWAADWIRGLFVFMCGPLIPFVLLFSALNQRLRKWSCCVCTKDLSEEEKSLWVTKEVQNQIDSARKWEWSSVLVKALWWGIAYMVLNVIVAKWVILLLSILVNAFKDQSLGVVTCIIIAVGLFLFLLPPVPGVPIYMTAGIMLILPCQKAGLNDVTAVLYMFIVCMCIKLFACSCQQMGFGKTAKKYVAIRQMVGINTATIRTMKLILSRPGLSIAKVAILVGGPDWPTSVLCGIMGLDLLPILFGTLPVGALVLPTILMGVFMYYGGKG